MEASSQKKATGKRRNDIDEDREDVAESKDDGELPPAPKRTKTYEEAATPEKEAVSEMGATPPQVGPAQSENGETRQSHREQMQLLISAFSNEQQDQYEIFRRSTFPKSSIRRIMQSVCSTNVPQNAVIAMAGITKVYVGEMVEAACQARDELGEEGPLQPKHIREAVRRLRRENKVPNSRYKRVFPFR